MSLKKINEAVNILKSGKLPYLTMYFVLEDGNDNYSIRQVDIDAGIQSRLSSQFLKFLVEKFHSEKLVIGNVSTADERVYDILQFDLDLVPPLDLITGIEDNSDQPKYSFQSDGKDSVDGYLFIMGNGKSEISFYKKHYPMDSISRDKLVLFGRSDSRFTQINDDEVYRLNNKIDLLTVDSNLFVLNMSVMERNFKIHDVLKKKAESVVREIDKKQFLENSKFIKEIISENPAFARKVLKLNLSSPVLKLAFADIKSFVTKHPLLQGKLKFNAKGAKFQLTSKNSAKLFLKLMDDDFLRSELTQRLYDSIVKENI